jgi:cholesterol transport system auxiliary component
MRHDESPAARLRGGGCIAAALFVSGCALMGGSSKPATLYQLSSTSVAPSSIANGSVPVVILYAGSSFDRQSQGDRIMTTTGNQVAYIASARWAAPAQEMFDSVAIQQLQSGPARVRIIRAGAPPLSAYVLAIDVRRFDAEYTSAGPAPDVVVEGRAKLMRVADRQIIGDWPISAREHAQANRVGEIVAAFDRATKTVTDQVAVQTSTAVQAR